MKNSGCTRVSFHIKGTFLEARLMGSKTEGVVMRTKVPPSSKILEF